MADQRSRPRPNTQVVGFRISKELAAELKAEAKNRKVLLNELLAEMWKLYQNQLR